MGGLQRSPDVLQVTLLEAVAYGEVRVHPRREAPLEEVLEPSSSADASGQVVHPRCHVRLDDGREERSEPATRPGAPLPGKAQPSPPAEEVGEKDVRVLEELVAA